jgi:4-diphosphocytidyl-2-C-methyl-D-erythritol kinase
MLCPMPTEFAPAKINLYLHVTGRREDGYHFLDSLVAFVDVGDDLAFAEADTITLSVQGPFAGGAGPVEDNLVLRAARRLREAAGVTRGACITLRKNLPVAAGLGGGSSDAAATLRGLTRLWGIAPGAVDLIGIARSLGQDVPVCLTRAPAFFRGIGDSFDPAGDVPRMGVLLVNPGEPVATPDAFRRRRGPFSRENRPPAGRGDAAAFVAELVRRGNDLTEAACEVAPGTRTVLAAMAGAENCRLARMSGTGATCFGLFDDMPAARAAADRIRREHPGWWIAPAGWFRAG